MAAERLWQYLRKGWHEKVGDDLSRGRGQAGAQLLRRVASGPHPWTANGNNGTEPLYTYYICC
jgi:hypothetical protein